jgi:hypothetical protein
MAPKVTSAKAQLSVLKNAILDDFIQSGENEKLGTIMKDGVLYFKRERYPVRAVTAHGMRTAAKS